MNQGTRNKERTEDACNKVRDQEGSKEQGRKQTKGYYGHEANTSAALGQCDVGARV